MSKKMGKQTYKPGTPPVIISTGAVTGPFEGRGPLGKYMDYVYPDNMAAEQSFENAEKAMMLNACFTCLQKGGKTGPQVDFFLSGDLLNQTITSGFSAMELGIPYFGIYGACSSSAEGLALASMLIDGGFAELVLTATASHNSTAERQFRYPTEYGSFRKPTVQWTVTGAGAALLSATGKGPVITHITIGKVTDLGIKDPHNLGAAMAPAAARTMIQHFSDTGRSPDYYDLIVTGDLGRVGHDLAAKEASSKGGFNLNRNYSDCGVMLYDTEKQDVHSGGSGCAASAVVTYGYLYKKLITRDLQKILLVATGALHSPTSCQQGSSIPGIAHALSIEMPHNPD